MKKICLYCGGEYETTQSKSKYCSIKCGQRDRKNYKNPNTEIRIRIWSKKLRAYDMFGNKCEKCGDTNMLHFVFHHIKPNDKDHQLCDIWQNRWSKIEKELKKCSLLCENCHKELHHKKELIDNRFRYSKTLLVEYKGNRCEKCGYDKCIDSLVFHHKDENDKEYAIGDIKLRITTLEKLTTDLKCELDKCELICANCHREEHSKDLTDLMDEIINKKETYREQAKIIDKEEVKRLSFVENKNSKEIAKILNCSSSGVRNILKRIREE